MATFQIQKPVLAALRSVFGVKGTENVQSLELGPASPVFDIIETAEFANPDFPDFGYFLWAQDIILAVSGDVNTLIYGAVEADIPAFDRKFHRIWLMGPPIVSVVGDGTNLTNFITGIVNPWQVGSGGTAAPAIVTFFSDQPIPVATDVVWTQGTAGIPLLNIILPTGLGGSMLSVPSTPRYPMYLQVAASSYTNSVIIGATTFNLAYPIWVGPIGIRPPRI